MSKGTLAFRMFVAAFLIFSFCLSTWHLSDKSEMAAWAIFAVPLALLALELIGIIQAYQRRKESLDKLLRVVTLMNLGILMSGLVSMFMRHQ